MLQLYKEQQNEENRNFIACFKKHKKFVNTRKNLKQTAITNYFT